MSKIVVVAGARPNFIKIAPLMSALATVRGCSAHFSAYRAAL